MDHRIVFPADPLDLFAHAEIARHRPQRLSRQRFRGGGRMGAARHRPAPPGEEPRRRQPQKPATGHQHAPPVEKLDPARKHPARPRNRSTRSSIAPRGPAAASSGRPPTSRRTAPRTASSQKGVASAVSIGSPLEPAREEDGALQRVAIGELEVQHPPLLQPERRHADLLLRLAHRRLLGRLARLDLPSRRIHLARAEPAPLVDQQHPPALHDEAEHRALEGEPVFPIRRHAERIPGEAARGERRLIRAFKFAPERLNSLPSPREYPPRPPSRRALRFPGRSPRAQWARTR